MISIIEQTIVSTLAYSLVASRLLTMLSLLKISDTFNPPRPPNGAEVPTAGGQGRRGHGGSTSLGWYRTHDDLQALGR